MRVQHTPVVCRLYRFIIGDDMFVFTGKAGAKAAASRKSVNKPAVTKPNTIKSLFMNSNVKRPAEVSFPFSFFFFFFFGQLVLHLGQIH